MVLASIRRRLAEKRSGRPDYHDDRVDAAMVKIPRIAPAVLIEHALCVVGLFVVPLVLLRPAIFDGQFPLDTDSIYYALPWEEARPEGLPQDDLGGPRETVDQYYPGFAFLNEAALTGESIQWNPREGFGSPHVAQWRTRALSPFSIPYYFFDLQVAITLSLFAKIAIAGLATFLTTRILWLRPSSAFLVSVAYQVSPVFLLSWHAPMADAVAWFPFMLIMFERFGGGRTRVWPACAMVLALMLLGGDPESVMATLLFGVIYIFARSVLSGRSVRHAITPAIVLGISAIAGAAMTSIQLLPFAEWLRNAESPVAPTGVENLRLADLVMMFLPQWYGAPELSTIGGPDAKRSLLAGFLFLSAPLCLAFPYWFAMRRELKPERTPLPDTLVAMSIASVLLGVAVAVIGTVSIGFLHFTSAHFWFPLSLWAALLLARSGEEWSRLLPDPCQDALKRFLLYVPALILLWIAAFLLSGPNVVGVSRGLQFLSLCAVTAAFIVFIAGTALKPNLMVFAYASALMIASLSLYAYGSAQPFRSPDAIFPRTETIAAFAKTQDRLGGSGVIAHWPLNGNGIANTAVRAGQSTLRHRRFENATQKDPALLTRTGLRQLILQDVDLETTYAPIRDQMRITRSFSAGAFWVELLDPVPRARLIYATRPVPMGSEVPMSSNSPPVVEGGPVLLENEPSQGGWAGVYAAIDDPNVFDVDAAAPAVLVIADAWYPGWQALVDGKQTGVIPVDALFRGVPISQGTHRVELFFDPQSYRIGRGISALATLIVLVAFIGRITTAIRKRRRLR